MHHFKDASPEAFTPAKHVVLWRREKTPELNCERVQIIFPPCGLGLGNPCCDAVLNQQRGTAPRKYHYADNTKNRRDLHVVADTPVIRNVFARVRRRRPVSKR